jgi:hypothetical protein
MDRPQALERLVHVERLATSGAPGEREAAKARAKRIRARWKITDAELEAATTILEESELPRSQRGRRRPTSSPPPRRERPRGPSSARFFDDFIRNMGGNFGFSTDWDGHAADYDDWPPNVPRPPHGPYREKPGAEPVPDEVELICTCGHVSKRVLVNPHTTTIQAYRCDGCQRMRHYAQHDFVVKGDERSASEAYAEDHGRERTARGHTPTGEVHDEAAGMGREENFDEVHHFAFTPKDPGPIRFTSGTGPLWGIKGNVSGRVTHVDEDGTIHFTFDDG